ncbi:Nucleotidyl_cyclase [Hexamita inflata]|uniref:Nucleotidyl_cyclase n=1 Tax=Hexamita inflata TaxID=28002 RepID=A0ABP1GK51_9EUKA
MKAENLPCNVVNNVNCCYIYIKSNGLDSVQYISKINEFYSFLDFVCDILCVQKIKSSCEYYMCCTGAQQHLNDETNIKETQYLNQYDSSKLLCTYALIANEAAQLFGFQCSCGITKGSVIIGAVSISTNIINFDTYGDSINTAARIARNNTNGVYLSICDYQSKEIYYPDIVQDNEYNDEQLTNLIKKDINIDQSKEIFIKASPQYIFDQLHEKEYKGKGQIKIIQLLSIPTLKQYTCQALQHAYIQTSQQYFKEFNEQMGNNLFQTEQFDESLIEQPESFISVQASQDDECSDSNISFDNLDLNNLQILPENNNNDFNVTERIEQLQQSAPAIFTVKKEVQKISHWQYQQKLFNSRRDSISSVVQSNEYVTNASGENSVDQQKITFEFGSFARSNDFATHTYSSEKIRFNNDSNNSTMSNEEPVGSLLQPNLVKFFEVAQSSNTLRRTASQMLFESKPADATSKFHMQLLQEEDEIMQIQQNYQDELQKQEITFISSEDSDQINSTSEIQEMVLHNPKELKVNEQIEKLDQINTQISQVNPRPKIQNNFYSNYLQLGQIYQFMINFSKLYFEQVSENQEIFQSILKQVTIKTNFVLILYPLIQYLMGLFMIPQYNKLYIFSYQFNVKNLYCNIVMLKCITILLQHQLKKLKLQQLQCSYNAKQHKQHIKEIFKGKFNRILQVILVIIQILETLEYLVINESYTNYRNILLNKQHESIIISNIIFQQCNYLINSYQARLYSLISYQYQIKLIQLLVIFCLFLRKQLIIPLVFILNNVILSILQYTKFKTLIVDQTIKSEMLTQIQHGKQLLKNILPQISIDALLLTTLDQKSQDIVLLSGNKYQIQYLNTFECLLKQNQLSTFKQSLTQCYKNDYYSYRLSSLIQKYLILPNTRSLGQQRPLINFGNVGYLNLDVQQFTYFCSKHTTAENLHFLSKLFNKFDQRMKLAKNLIQVKISGDSYEIMSLPTIIKKYSANFDVNDVKIQQIQQYECIIQLIAVGLGFIQDCKAVLQTYLTWKDIVGLRVGISFGEVTGSILGNKICRFDTFGAVPIEAEQAQSNAPKNTIMLNEKVMKLLQNSNCIKEYIVDYLTSETMRSRKVNFNDEEINFHFVENNYGVYIDGLIK